MKALFVELPAFERHRSADLTDEEFLRLQELLMANPAAGDLIEGTGGLRKLLRARIKAELEARRKP